MRRHWSAALALLLVLAGPARMPLVRAEDASPFPPARSRLLAAVDSLHTARNVGAADSLLATGLADLTDQDGAFELELLVRRGRLYTSFGQAARGAPILNRAIDLAEARGDSLNLARSIRWLSLAEGIQGRKEAAGVLYRRLRDVAVARGDGLHEGWALVGLGWEALNRGLLDEARSHYERAVALFVGLGDHDAEIWARNGYALVLQRQGDYRTALDIYRELMEVARRTDYTVVEAMACNNLGSLTQKLGDPGAAIPHYERARELQLSAHQRREAVIPALNIAVCRIEQGHHADAADLLLPLERQCAEEGYPDLQADVIYELARVRAVQGRLAEAASLHRRIDRLTTELPVGSHVRNITGLARVLAEMDSTEAALDVVERGREAYLERTAGGERLMLNLGYGVRLADAGRPTAALATLDAVAAEAAASGLTGYRISARSRGGEIHLATGRPDSALAWYRLAAAAWEDERGLPLDPRWREQRGIDGQRIYPRLADLLFDADDPRTAHDAVHAFKARTLSETMLGPGIYGAPAAPAAVDGDGVLEALQSSALRPGELFLDYYLGEEGSFVFAATDGELRAARLPALPELADLLRNYRALLAARRSGDDTGAAAARLARVLFGGIEDLVAGARAVVWAPDGPLHRIPLASLPVPGERTSGSLLSDTRTITRVPSAATLLHLRRNGPVAREPGRAAILAVAGSVGGDGAAWDGPRRETAGLARSYAGVRLLTDPDPSGLLAERGETILHLAAHAVVDPHRPWRSAFVLGPDPEHELLRAADIARGRLDYRLAVLASCESVGSRAVAGEGQMGISSAFLGAGVPAVVATLWPVSDRTAMAFSAVFYDALAGGGSTAEALGEARGSLRAESGTAHPGAWASFVLAGDGDGRFVLEKRESGPGIWWLALAAALVAGVVWWIRFRAG